MLTLNSAIKKMTLLPAQRLEGMCVAFRKKGRLQEGCDADLTVFDPEKVIDNATFQQPMIPSSGVHYVLVLGVPVVYQGELNCDTMPGIGYRS